MFLPALNKLRKTLTVADPMRPQIESNFVDTLYCRTSVFGKRLCLKDRNLLRRMQFTVATALQII
jgi:hypothetical protein